MLTIKTNGVFMKRFLQVFGLALTAAVVASCTDPNPELVYNLNANPDNDIVGPRIVSHIDSAGFRNMDFVSDNGKVNEIIAANDGNGNYKYKFEFVYNNDKLIGHKYFQTGVLGYKEMALTYENANSTKIVGATELNYPTVPGVTPITQTDVTFSYNSYNRVTEILKKSKGYGGANYDNYVKLTIYYSGDNISKMKEEFGYFSGGFMEAPFMSTDYSYTIFDNKFSPYSTLPKAIGLAVGTADTSLLTYNNKNNWRKFVVSGVTGSFNYEKSYKYDTQNYVKSDSTEVFKYYYEALQP